MTERPPTSGNTLAQARIEHATPSPEAGDLWRARWTDRAGVVLVLTRVADQLRVAPASLDELPDETAVHAPAATNTLGFDIAIWASDDADIPLRVLDYKLGHLNEDLSSLERGSTNWGPTDPRTLARAHAQDLIEALQAAEWAPTGTTNLNLAVTLTGADVRAIADVLGSPKRAAALRRGQVDLTTDEATQLSELLDIPADALLAATRPPLPDDLVAAMDFPNVRSLVDRLAARRGTDEVETWRTAAYGVLSLAAREHDRRDARWDGRIRAYFQAQLRGNQTGPDQ